MPLLAVGLPYLAWRRSSNDSIASADNASRNLLFVDCTSVLLNSSPHHEGFFMLDPIKPTEIKQEQPKDERIFIVIPFRALHDKKLSIQRMRALLACCSYANHNGTLFPSTDRLAADLGIAPSTMAAHIKYLTERGYLKTINNSYTVGKHAKPRAVVYDPDNPPADEDIEQRETEERQVLADKKALQDQQAKLIEARESNQGLKCDPTSLFRVWGKGLRKFGVQPQYDHQTFTTLAKTVTPDELEKIATPYFNSLKYPPSSARALLRLVKK